MATSAEDKQWDAIDKIRDDMSAVREHVASATTEIKGDVKNLAALMELHIKDISIHERPPCSYFRGLEAKVWAVAVATIGSMGAAIYALVTK